MPDSENLEFDRSRGIVWVCDVVGSSKYLNDNETAGDLEDFLFRLYWLSMQVVRAADGRFIKWTGDGFLAWFETDLHRDVETKSNNVFSAAALLSTLVAITQLGLTPKSRFKIRHGVTYEQDALITRIKHEGGYESLDIIGRGVVLAFRLCSIRSEIPHIITQGDLVYEPRPNQIGVFKFKRVAFKPEDYLRYFKGERWGTHSIYKAVRGRWGKRIASKMLELGSNLSNPQILNSVLSNLGIDSVFLSRLLSYMASGPEWSKELLNNYLLTLSREVVEFIMKQGTKADDSTVKEFKKFSKDFRARYGLK
jgi:hypothetical protein